MTNYITQLTRWLVDLANQFVLNYFVENLLQHGLLSGVCLVSSQGRLIYSYGELESVTKVNKAMFSFHIAQSIKFNFMKDGSNNEVNGICLQADLAQFVTAFRYVSSKSEAEVYNKGFTVVYNQKKKLFKIFQKTLSR